MIKTEGYGNITLWIYGAPGEIRTPDHLVRSQVLYPTELRARIGKQIKMMLFTCLARKTVRRRILSTSAP